MQEANLGVGGMSCEKCVAALEKVLLALPGVERAVVSLAGASAVVVFDADRVSLAQLRAAVENAGFDVTR